MQSTFFRRSFLAEFFGTFIMIFIGTGVIVFQKVESYPNLLMIAMAFGFAIMGSIYAFGDISGGHFNPAVTFAMALNGRTHWRTAIGYIIWQILGAIAGSLSVLVAMALFSKTPAITQISQGNAVSLDKLVQAIGFGATDFPKGQWLLATAVEAIVTFLLVLLVLNLTSTKYVENGLTGIIVSFFVMALVLFAAPLTGAGLNPARSIAPALVQSLFDTKASHALIGLPVYIIGPMIGAVIAAYIARTVLQTENKNEVLAARRARAKAQRSNDVVVSDDDEKETVKTKAKKSTKK